MSDPVIKIKSPTGVEVLAEVEQASCLICDEHLHIYGANISVFTEGVAYGLACIKKLNEALNKITPPGVM